MVRQNIADRASQPQRWGSEPRESRRQKKSRFPGQAYHSLAAREGSFPFLNFFFLQESLLGLGRRSLRDGQENVEDGKQELERRGGRVLREELEPWLASLDGSWIPWNYGANNRPGCVTFRTRQRKLRLAPVKGRMASLSFQEGLSLFCTELKK